VPHTYSFRVVDEYGWEYGHPDIYLDAPWEYWFDYKDQL